MATSIYVTSAEGRSGKSTVAVGVLEALKGTVERVGVFRPVARSQQEGDYVLDMLLERSTAGMTAAQSTGSDYAEVNTDRDAAFARIVDRYSAVERACDAVLILGSDYTDVGSPTEFATNARIAADLAAPVMLVLNGRAPDDATARTPDEVVAVARVALAELHAEHAEAAAVVINRADPASAAAIAAAVRVESGLPAWAIPEDADLTAPLLRSVLDAVHGELLFGDEALLDRPVRGTIVAAMTMENVLPRLVEGNVVVVPGDRSDVLVGTVVAHLSQTFPGLAAIVLNGGFPLAPAISRLLEGLGATLPIARCESGTYDTAVRILNTRSRLAADSPQKYATALGLFERNVEPSELTAVLRLQPSTVMTPVRFEHALLERARSRTMRIVLPEGDDDRILRAAGVVLRRGIADLTILGEEAVVRARAGELGLDLSAARVISPRDPALHERFTAEYLELRKAKGVDHELAAERMADVAYFGTMLVHDGLADGMVSGAAHTTAHTIRPAFEIVKTSPGVSVVSSVFLMALADRVLVYGDCAVIPEPTSEQLADIAISSAATARLFGIEPRVAMLSYSTGASGSGSDVDKVRRATELVLERAPELPVAGPIQYDAAADPEVGAAKLPGSPVAGHATVFVFPDLNTGNNTYKAVQRSAGAVAIGPVLQGLARPINDLSRGALVRDIVNTIAITAIQAQELG
ncbi:MAG TPA: phosphate acetyltransferase [Pseudolysinimonas sp.]|nr:phosphate acetyltransferase [Pseudolysinimonas sp.]